MIAAMDLLADLEARGLVNDSTDLAALATRLAAGPIGAYVGFDPTADSLHAGHLLGQITLRRFQLAGHRPFPLAGGATGMVGDPGGRSEERNLLDRETLEHNISRIKAQLERLLDFTPGPTQATLVDNAEWTAPLGVLDFLRDVGKHMTVNQMVAKESVRSRMEGEHGISYTEFSYMLLQANDFRWLCEHHDVELQMGGSDQWGNITAGIDLIRRTLGRTAHGLTWPLLTLGGGAKMGKTAGGAVWLDAEKTSPYQFRQFWVQAGDAEVEQYLRRLSLQPLADVEELLEAHRAAPERRAAQRALATELTGLVHGQAAARAADEAAAVLFGGNPAAASSEAFAVVRREVGTTTVALEALDDVVGLLVTSGLARSNGEARRTLDQRGFHVNGHTLDAGTASLRTADRIEGRFLLLRRGKTSYHVVEVAERG
jgi:tyrosyl-tRNA synthetase